MGKPGKKIGTRGNGINVVGGKIVDEYVGKWRDMATRALARKIYSENNGVFGSEDNVRAMVMTRRGKGPHGSKYLGEKYEYEGVSGNKYHGYQEYLRRVGRVVSADLEDDLEFPESYASDFIPYKMNQSNVLIIGDIHLPYHDIEACKIALRTGKDRGVNGILINGDLIDFAGISRHEKDWRQRSVANEFEAARKFLVILRKMFPNAKIVFKEGNHDERWEKWLFNKAPEIFDDPEFTLSSRLRLGELGIEMVQDKKPVSLGKLISLHGHEMFGGSGGVNPARATFLKTLCDIVVNHYHKTSQHTSTTMNGNVVSVNSLGCLCGLTPHYMPINQHNLGFGHCEVDLKTGEYYLDNLKIINGKVY